MKFNISKKNGNKGGIYIIRSLISMDSYIGSTNHFFNRFCSHRGSLVSGKSKIKLLCQYAVLNGSECLSMEILEVIVANGDKLEAEKKWIRKLKPTLNINGFAEPKIYIIKRKFGTPELEKLFIDLRNCGLSMKRQGEIVGAYPHEISKMYSGENSNDGLFKKLMNVRSDFEKQFKKLEDAI